MLSISRLAINKSFAGEANPRNLSNMPCDIKRSTSVKGSINLKEENAFGGRIARQRAAAFLSTEVVPFFYSRDVWPVISDRS